MFWRDILVTLVVLCSLPFAFRRPIIGLMVFSWIAYMRVQDLCWSFARTQNFSQYVAIMMFSGFFLFERKSLFSKDVRAILMLVLTGVITYSALTTRYPVGPYVLYYLTEYIKIIMIALITIALVDRPERLRMLVWTITLSLGFFGFKGGLLGILTFGRPILRGPGGMLQDNNDFSLALTMNIPFLFYLGLTEPHKWIKRGLLATVPLTCLTILLTGSRGGFLSMSATLGVIVWRSRNRALGIAVAFIAAIVFLIFLPDNVKGRLGTLGNVKEDSSANARLHTWGIALKMIAANPLQGVGLRNFQTAYPDYDPNPLLQRGATGKEEARKAFFVAHNSYLQLAAESGIPALLIYLTIAASTFSLLRRIRWMALRRYETNWILNYVRMFEASLVGYFTGAIFLNRAHYDFYYHVIAIIVSFSTIAMAEMTSEAKYPMRSGAGVARAFANRGFFGPRTSSPELRSLGAESTALPVMGSVAVKSAPEKSAARRPGFDTTPASRTGTVGFDRSTDSPLKGRL